MDPRQSLFDRLTQLKASWPAPPWSWDSRFNTIVSSFTIDLDAKARASALHALPHEWTAQTIANASPSLRALAQRSGLRTGQRLLAGDDDLFGLWWPWGGGAKVSLRIGLGEHVDEMPRIRELFEVRL